MGKRLITIIEVEKYETQIVRQVGHDVRPSCQECCAGPMLFPEEAATVSQVSLRTIFRWIETARIHFCETAEGRLYLCSNSLPSTEVHSPSTEELQPTSRPGTGQCHERGIKNA